MELLIATLAPILVLAIAGIVWTIRTMSAQEARIKQLETEVASLRKRWHDLRDGTLKDAMKLFEEWKNDMTRKFEPRK